MLIDRDRIPEARDNLGRISNLIDRMASISRHLRNFARKPNEKLGPISIEEVVEETLEIVSARRNSGCDLVDELRARAAERQGGSVRLQQVLVNIVTNACDAVEGLDDRRIELSARRKQARVVIEIGDRGPVCHRRSWNASSIPSSRPRVSARGLVSAFDFLQHHQGFRRQSDSRAA